MVYIAPPETITQTVYVPDFNGKCNRDLVEYVIQIKTALLTANARLQGIQAWIKESIK